MIVPSSTETAVANGDTRTLNLYHSHSGESIQATFRVNGSYDPAVLEKLNWFLRDWRNNDRTRMDPRLFDVIWEVYRTAGATQPIVIISAYRSPQTNAMLRRRSKGVAEHSQHILGRAMDTTMPGMPMEKIREIGMRLQRGGVGWYPGSNFVHLDVASVRSWPRMSYDQLVRLFPDGKTVHLAADGRTLPRYQEARAELAARGGIMSDVAQAVPGSGLFAWLFGKHDNAASPSPSETAPQQPATLSLRRGGTTEVAALHAGGASLGAQYPAAAPDRADARPAPEENRTRVAGLDPAANLRGASAGPEPAGSGHQAGATDVPKDKLANRAVNSAAVPLPPERPSAASGALAVAFADVPTPPARPPSLTRLAAPAANKADQEGKLASAEITTPSGGGLEAPLARAANLPVMITKGLGDEEGMPKQVLAFAADAPLQDPFQQGEDAPQGKPAGKPAAQPGDAAQAPPSRPKPRNLTNNPPSTFPKPSILGQTLTGLRRAARLIPGALSSQPSAADYASAFGIETAEVDTDHFRGAAVQPLTLAQGFVRLTEN
jgi:uncharacterized protein YcbK (DUF882 family)